MTFGWTGQSKARHYRLMAFSTLLLATISPLSSVQAAGVSGIEIGDRQIVLRFDDDVEKATSFALAGPDRIAVDVSGAVPGATAGAEPAWPVAKIRQGRFDASTTRIVFDLASPALISGGTFSADGRALTLSLDPADPEQFSVVATGARQIYHSPTANMAGRARSKYSITVPLGAPRSSLPRPRIYGPVGRPLVVIDAGHGGHDPGAISPLTGKREKDVTLAVAQAIKDELVASGRVRVALTREGDNYIVLRDRSAIARNIKADLFISIHADAAPATTASGATIYTLSEVASDREAQALATRENKVDIINGVNLGGENREIASILVDLAQRETMNASAQFAGLLKREASGLVPFRIDYHRMAGFAVLKAPDTPAVLLEVGYVTNANDVARLSSSDGQRRIAQGLRKAIEIHFARRVASR
jgi:N-acetylmuramoyl-L-alanine amidase